MISGGAGGWWLVAGGCWRLAVGVRWMGMKLKRKPGQFDQVYVGAQMEPG